MLLVAMKDFPCTARVISSDPVRQARISLLQPGCRAPRPVHEVTRKKGLWNAPHQPVWAASHPHDGGTNHMLVFRAYTDKSPHDEARGAPLPDATFLGTARVGGKWWKGSWSFLEVYLGKKHLDRLCAHVGGEWILDRLLPGRIPGSIRTLSEAEAGGTPCLEGWIRL